MNRLYCTRLEVSAKSRNIQKLLYIKEVNISISEQLSEQCCSCHNQKG